MNDSLSKRTAQWEKLVEERKALKKRLAEIEMEIDRERNGLVKSIRQISYDGPISPREYQVLTIMRNHPEISNKEIAAIMHISERTVKFHVSSLLAKYGAMSRIELVLGEKKGDANT